MRGRWSGLIVALALAGWLAVGCNPVPSGTAPPSPPVPKGTLVPLPTMGLVPLAAVNATPMSAPTPSEDAEPSPTPPEMRTPTPQDLTIPTPEVVLNPTMRPESIDTPTREGRETSEPATGGDGASGGGGADGVVSRGEEIFVAHCTACHGASGQAGSVGPALAESALVGGPPEQVINVVLHGRNLMPAFADQLSDEDIAAVVSYVRNAWGNDAEAVTPEEVATQR
jgi:mono/diheme cytochrome c family protein